ncbi:Mor transcription activator family protein [Secundilactobacillus muriivasis]
MTEPVDKRLLQPLYERLEQLLGPEAMLMVWSEYKGTQINFPAHLYNRERVQRRLMREHLDDRPQQLARKYGYSQKWVQQVQREGRQRAEKQDQ